jgi:hypothetical protein
MGSPSFRLGCRGGDVNSEFWYELPRSGEGTETERDTQRKGEGEGEGEGEGGIERGNGHFLGSKRCHCDGGPGLYHGVFCDCRRTVTGRGGRKHTRRGKW